VAGGRGRVLGLLQADGKGILMDCTSTEVGFIPCLLFHEAGVKCYLIFCIDCGKDIRRECGD
jgi:hypothetical protein